jgi:hypothetical protein
MYDHGEGLLYGEAHLQPYTKTKQKRELHIQIPGASADKKWKESFTFDIKEEVVEIAPHLAALFTLRFDHVGSLYLATDELFGEKHIRFLS